MQKKIKILHLEDLRSDAELVERQLKNAGINFSIEVVDNKTKFAESLQRLNPDIVLADHSLPCFNAVEALTIMTELKIKIPLILITGAISEEDAVSVMMKGACDYILKDRLQRLPVAILNAVQKFQFEKEQLELQAQSQKRLEESEKRYREIVENAQEGIWITDTENNIVFANKKISDILGYSMEEIIGRSRFYFEVDPSNVSIKPQECETNVNYECTLRSKNGNIVWVNLSGNPLVDERGKCKGALAMIADITRRKEVDEELKKLHLELENSAAELVESNRELERFAYIASHDLQEPLRMVSSFLQRLQEKYNGQLDDTAGKYIHFAVDGAERMKALISDLLEFSRVSTVKRENKPVDINGLVSSSLLNLKPFADRSQASISVDVFPQIIGNEVQLMQVFQNLISNALKYKGSASPVIKIGFTDEADSWHFFVKDNGLGISPENFDKIFEIFQRLHNRTEYPGTGLGLSICKKIVELHGGKIWVESARDNGSTFHFTISKPPKIL